MDTEMRLTHYIIYLGLIILLAISMSACGSKDSSVLDYQQMSIAQLEQGLYVEHDLECFTELVTRSCYDESLDIKKYACFVTDSLHSIHALTFIGNTPEEHLYYFALNEAYDGIDHTYVDLVGIMSVKDAISDHFDPLCWGNFEDADNINIDSLEKRVTENYDTLAYKELRSFVPITEIKTQAQFMADSAFLAMALQDMYNIICYEHYNGYPLDSATFALADIYLEKGVERGYLPCVFQKSLLLLMDVYLPQDTIEGKRLLDQCLKDPPCKTPFWRKPD